MANTSRGQVKNKKSLRVVGERDGAAELAGLLRQLAGAGAPEELLRELEAGGDAARIVDDLVELGLLPSPEQAMAGLLEGFTPLLGPGADPCSAELCGVEFLGLMRKLADDPTDLPGMLAALIGQAEDSGLPEALAMLRTVAVVGPEEVRPTATEAADRMVAAGLTDCSWVGELGTPKVRKCFGYCGFFGEQESIALTFSYGRKAHAVVVLIDHVLGGGVKDCFVTDRAKVIRAKFEMLTERTGCELVDYEPEHAHLILSKALSSAPCPVEPDQIEDVGNHLDLLRQRVDLLAEVGAVAPAKRVAARKRPTRSALARSLTQQG